MARKLISVPIETGLTEAVGEALEAAVLPPGTPVVAENVFFSRNKVLRLWRPAAEAVSGTTVDQGSALLSLYIPQWDKVAIMSTGYLNIYDSDFSSKDYSLVIGATVGSMSMLGDSLIVAIRGIPLRAIDFDGTSTYTLTMCGSLGGCDMPTASTYAATDLATGATSAGLQTLTMSYSSSKLYKLSYLRVRLARQTDAVGKVYCTFEKNIDAGGWTTVAVSDNHVYVGALPYGDTSADLSAQEFMECIFLFTNAVTTAGSSSVQIRATLTYSNGNAGDVVFILNEGAAWNSTYAMYSVISGTMYVQYNGSICPRPGSITTYKTRIFCADETEDPRRVCVSDINDPQDFDRTLHGTYFYTDFYPTCVWSMGDALFVSGSRSGRPVTVAYTGRWPESAFPAYEYDLGPVRNTEVLAVNRKVVTVSNGAVVIGTPTTYAGLLEWQYVNPPNGYMSPDNYFLMYEPVHNLMLFMDYASQEILCLQMASGQWSIWDMSEMTGNMKTICCVDGTIYITTATPNTYELVTAPTEDHTYDATVGLFFEGSPVQQFLLDSVTAMPPLPVGAEVTLTGWCETDDIDSISPTQYWTDTFTVRADAEYKGFYKLFLDSISPYQRMFNHLYYKVVVPDDIEKVSTSALKSLGLFVQQDAESNQKGVD